MRLQSYVFCAFLFVGGLSGPRAMAAGTEGCGTSTGDTTLSVSGTQGLSFTPYRLGTYRTDVSARDIELLWDTLYGAFTGDARATLDRFIESMVVTTGTNPTATDATNLQVVYNTLRREGSNWNAANPSDSLSYRVGYNVPANELTETIASYTNADRAHSDIYLYHPSRKTPEIADGRWPSIDFLSDNEDFTTGHAATDPKRLNSVMYLGPPPESAIDLTGTGWTSPAARWRLNVSHEIAHSFPPGDSRGPLTELWSAAAEALNGIHDTSASAEVPYTWSLLAATPGPSALPGCTEVRRSTSNYQARTSFMAYVAYGFLNADSARTIAGSSDDLLSRWAKIPAGNRTLGSLQPFLSDANCATCSSASYFRRGTTALSNRERMNVLIHNWRVANFVNAPNLAERQFGYPAWAGFTPAVNQKAWQAIDGCATDDIVALPAIMTIGSGQLTRDLVLSGQRSFRGASYPLSLVPFGSNYWVIRADASITTANRDLVVRVVPEGTVNCGGFTLSLLASAVAYTTADATGDESTLWQNPSGASVATAVQMTDVDSATTAIEVVIPNFGLTNRSAVLVLTAGDGPVGNFSDITNGLAYGEALPYRIEAGLRTAPFQSINPLAVSARPELPEGMPTWSPTGNEVAYYSVDPAVSSQPQIFRRLLDGSPAVALAPQVAEQLAPDWSPRGDAIAFENVQIGATSSRVWIADLVPGATATLRQLTTLPGCASMPTFQPNGRGLVYTHIPNPTGDAQCYLRWISLDGFGDGLIAHLGGPTNFHRKPRWSTDGKTIYFPIAELGDRVVAFPWQGGAGVTVAKISPATVNLDVHPGSGRIAVESWATPINGIVNVPLPIDCPGGGPQIISHRIAFQDTLVAGSGPAFRVSDRVNFAHQPAYSPDGVRIAYQSQNRFTSNGSIEVRQISWNHPPVFTSGVDDQALTAGVPFQVTLQAVDPDGEPITFKADYLPPGATLYAGNTFRWLNPGSGDFFPVFRALDGSGGVAKRVVRFTVASDGGNGDPFRDGDGGCTACAVAPALATSMNAGVAGESAGNSYLNGALPGAWTSTTSRVTRIAYDAGDNLSVNLNAPLPGMVTLDRAHLIYVEHAPTERAIATSAGVLVGTLETVASIMSSTGEDIMQALLPMAASGGAVAISAGSKLEVRWSPETDYSAIAVDCAHTGSGWGDGSGIEVQVLVDGAWQTIDRVTPRQGFDLVGANIGTATEVRLVFLAEAQLRSVHGMTAVGSADVHDLAPNSTSWPAGAGALALADSGAATLATGESIVMTFPVGPASSGSVRSCFLSLRAAYTPPTGAWSARSHPLGPDIPNQFALHQNQPNPFTGSTRLRFELPRRSPVRIEIFDALGRRVKTIVDQVLEPGSHVFNWDGRDTRRNQVEPGVYLYAMKAGEFRAQRRLVLLPH